MYSFLRKNAPMDMDRVIEEEANQKPGENQPSQ
jgi:hypothetical protein